MYIEPPYKVFTAKSGKTRVVIARDRNMIHPWLWGASVSKLACWNEEIGSFLPAIHKNDKIQKQLKAKYLLYESREEVGQWCKIKGQSQRCYGITYLDKYGDLVLHTEWDPEAYYDGAIFLSADEYAADNPECPQSHTEVCSCLEAQLEHDFGLLRAFMTECFFMLNLERRCESCGMWKIEDRCGGFNCLSPDDSEMLWNMSEELKGLADTEDILEQMLDKNSK